MTSPDTMLAKDKPKMAMKMNIIQSLSAIPADAKIFFINLKNKESVTSPVKVE